MYTQAHATKTTKQHEEPILFTVQYMPLTNHITTNPICTSPQITTPSPRITNILFIDNMLGIVHEANDRITE
jgi:hypothetical protein